MRVHRFLLLLIPLGALMAGFGGCGITLSEGTGGWGGGTVSVSVGTSSSGSIQTGAGGTAAGQLAATCTTAADCGGGLDCLGPTDADPIFGGGAPGGFCTKACTLDAECAQQGGICYRIDLGQPGRCTLSCGFGPAIDGVSGLFTALDPGKCRGRDDLRCVKTASAADACLPTCGSDAQCAGGRCDPRAAICVATPSTGAPTGAACDPAKEPSACAGLCIGFQTGVAMCSEPCVLGGAGPASPDCGGAAHGLCAFHPATNGAGDTGFCTPACATQAECQTPSFWCFSVPKLTEVVYRGYCFAAAPCPNGPADCASSPDAGAGPGYVCTKTSAGPLCLDPAFPLDADAGAGDAGSTDAGLLDGGPVDAGGTDASTLDGGSLDAGAGDASSGDAGSGDAGSGDAGSGDAGDGG